MMTLFRGQCWGRRCWVATIRPWSSLSSNTLRVRAPSEASSALLIANMVRVRRSRLMRMFISISANSGIFWIALWNCFASSDTTRQAVRAVAVALRGSWLMAAISPKISPALTTSMALPPRVRATSPSSSRYIRSLFWFSVKNTPPFGTLSSFPSDSKQIRATFGS